MKCYTGRLTWTDSSKRRKEKKQTLGRPRRRWEDNSEMNVKETGWESVDWINLPPGQGQVVSSCEHGNEHLGSVKGKVHRVNVTILKGRI